MNYSVDYDSYEISQNLDKYNNSYIYGEVNPKDIISVIKSLNYDNCSFLDIGSGCGKIVISIAEGLNIYCTGVEIDKNRFNKSLDLLKKFNLFSYVDIINDNFQNIYFGNYDLIYCCNTVFEKEENKLLYSKLLKEFTGYVLLFNYDHNLKKYLKFKKNVLTSWSNNVTLYVFLI